MKRKIVQISAVAECKAHKGGIYALCDDGTLWVSEGDKWEELENVPQLETKKTCPARAAGGKARMAKMTATERSKLQRMARRDRGDEQ